MRRARVALCLVAALLLSLALVAPVAAAGPGDEATSPIPITEFEVFQAYDTSLASTNEATDPTECGSFTGPFTNTVWHSFEVPADGPIVVAVNSFPDPEAEGFLAILFVYADDGAGGRELVGCNAFGSEVTFDATAGTTYLAMTGSLPETPVGGPAEIIVATPPTIDLTVDPEGTFNPITGVATVSGTFSCSEEMTIDVFATLVQTIGNHEVIGFAEAFGIPCGPEAQAGFLEFSGFNSRLNPGRATVFADAFGCTIVCASAFVEAEVRLRSRPEQPPPPPPPPANDEPAGAFPLAVGATATQDTSSATSDAADAAECPTQPFPPSGHTVWYAVTAAADSFIEVNTIGSGFDTTLHVLAPDGSLVGCNDDIIPGVDQDSRVVFAATGGVTYLIQVGTFADTPGGDLVLTALETDEPPPPPPVGDPPANDDRADALPISLGETLGPIDTTGATPELDDPTGVCASPSPFTVWFSYTAEASGWVAADTFDSDYDTVLIAVQGDEVLACSDDAPGGQTGSSEVVFFTEAGVTYHLMASSFNGVPGGNLVVSLRPSEPPLQVEVVVEGGTVRDGVATITGTATCSDAATVDMFGALEQTKGRFTTIGFGELFGLACGPDGASFAMEVIAGGKGFGPGDALLSLDAFASTEDEFAFGSVQTTVNLRPGGP